MKNFVKQNLRLTRKLYRELVASLAKRGVGGTFVFAVDKLSSRKKEFSEKYADDAFDKKYNVETAKIIKTSEIETRSKNWKFAVRYEPTDSAYSFKEILSSFHIDYSDYTFIDLGSGKGRAVLLASMLPFKRIIGVEFSETLIDTARKNISQFPGDQQLCKNIELLLMDASEYPFPGPGEKFVLFMNNPFHEPILEKVIENVSKSFYLNPRRIIIIYINPQFSKIIQTLPFLQKHDYPDDLNSDLYDVKPEFQKL
jgi:SAM-dependent methyltransferase